MSVYVDPENWRQPGVNSVIVDSDGKSNRDALLEIEQWAFESGFARTTEYWLRPILRADGKRVFRGLCYRLTPEERNSAAERTRAIDETLERMPKSA